MRIALVNQQLQKKIANIIDIPITVEVSVLVCLAFGQTTFFHFRSYISKKSQIVSYYLFLLKIILFLNVE